MYFLLFIAEIIILFFLSRKIIFGVMRFIYSVTKSERSTDIIYAILFLPGTFFHEAAHFLMALFLLVPVGNIELMPKREGDSLKLGSVPIGKTDPIRRMLVGAAPLIFGILAILLGLYFAISRGMLPGGIWINLTAIYLIFQIGNTMFMSKKDTEGMWVAVFLFVIIFAVFYFLGVSLSIQESTNEIINNVLKQSVIYLSIPIAIDIAILLLLRLNRR